MRSPALKPDIEVLTPKVGRTTGEIATDIVSDILADKVQKKGEPMHDPH